jgi:hypothetical protein
LLIRLDERDFQAAFDHAQATADQRTATLAGLQAKYVWQQSMIQQAESSLAVKLAQATFARQDAARYRDLAKTTFGTVQNAQRTSALDEAAPREAPGGPLNFGSPKNFDSSCSMGPCVAVGEADPTNVDMETLVNGERRQRFNTRDMVFTFGEYLEYLSRDFTLYPGDIISGGTAAGTAADSSDLLPDNTSAPERFLKPGDIVEMSSPGIGSLRTRVVAKER